MQHKLKTNTIFENLWISKSNHRILGDLIWKNTKFKFQNKLKEYYFEKLPNIKSNHRILNPRLRRTADTALYQKVFVYDCHCQLSAQLPLIRIIIIKYQISSPCWSAESLGYISLQWAKLPHPLVFCEAWKTESQAIALGIINTILVFWHFSAAETWSGWNTWKDVWFCGRADLKFGNLYCCLNFRQWNCLNWNIVGLFIIITVTPINVTTVSPSIVYILDIWHRYCQIWCWSTVACCSSGEMRIQTNIWVKIAIHVI